MKKQSGFEKFIKGKKKAGTVKEEIKQQKRKLRKEIEEKIEEKRKQRFQFQNPEYKPQQERKGNARFSVNKEKPSRDQSGRPDKRSSNFRTQDSKPVKKAYGPRVNKSSGPSESRINKGTRSSESHTNKGTRSSELRINKGTRSSESPIKRGAKEISLKPRPQSFQGPNQKPLQKPDQKLEQKSDQMPLNKYIAHCGVCSRRDAADVVRKGKVKVNGELITEPGHKVSTHDTITVAGKKVNPVKNLIYILLNKPKDYITTTDDPQNRKTVLDLIKQATHERVYPIGRLDRNTSGVLLLTNDGDLSQKLTHPSNEIRKIYAVTLDKPLEKNHFEAILKGVQLEDGVANVDVLAYTDAKDKTQIGVELHTGRNRIVRRIFEHLGYDVKNLDRVMFAGLTKKNVERGKWRFLNEREVRELKYFRKGK